MTAPTVARIEATQASATATVGANVSSTAAVGDLAILVAHGNATSIPNSQIDYSGGGDAGYTQITTVDGSGGARCRIWRKTLVSGDFSGSNFVAVGPNGWTTSGTSRLSLYIFRHANGWSSATLVSATHNSNVANGSTIATLTDSSRPAIAVTAVTYGSAQTGLQITWDGGSAQDPYVDESTSQIGSGVPGNHYGTGTGVCQGDFKLYDSADTPATIAYSAGLANTTHAIVAVEIETAAPPVTVGTATETDTALAIGHTRARSIGTATETDTALAIGAGTGVPLTAADETDTALPIGHTKTRALGTAAETDTALALVSRRELAIVTALEEDVAAPVPWTKTATITFGLTTAAAGVYASRTLRAWAKKMASTDAGDIRLTLLEGSTVVTTGAWQTLTTTNTAHTTTIDGVVGDYANLRAQIEVRTSSTVTVRVAQVELELSSDLGLATETDAALAIGHTRARTIGVALETDTAIAIAYKRAITLGVAVETDTALVIVIPRNWDWRIGTPRAQWDVDTPRAQWHVGTPRR
jgi:hypothetical protein